MDDDEIYEETLTEPGFVEEPLDDLEQRHDAGSIDSVELGFSKGYEEDKDEDHGPAQRRPHRHSSEKTQGGEEIAKEDDADKDLDAVDPFTSADFDF